MTKPDGTSDFDKIITEINSLVFSSALPKPGIQHCKDLYNAGLEAAAAEII